MAFKKPTTSESVKPGTPAARGGQLQQRSPFLFEFLAGTVWEDGSRRETGTVLLFAEAGLFKACLRDRACRRVGFLSGDTFEGLLATIENSLQEDSVDWRPEKPPPGRR